MNDLSVNELINNLSQTRKLLLVNNSLNEESFSLETSLKSDDYFSKFSLKKSFIINGILILIAHVFANFKLAFLNEIADIILAIYFKIGFMLIYFPSKVISSLGDYSWNDFTFNASNKDIKPFIIGWFILVFLLYILANMYLKNKGNANLKNDTLKYKGMFQNNIKRKEEIKAQINNNLLIIKRTTAIPQDYCYDLNAVSCFLSYLINRRADTLKECINLYHQELQHQEMMDYVSSVESDLYDLKSETESLSNENYELRKEVNDLKENQNTYHY